MNFQPSCTISKVSLFRHPKHKAHSIQKQKVNYKRNQSILQFTQEFVENIYCSKILYVKHALTKQESILLSSYQNIFSYRALFILSFKKRKLFIKSTFLLVHGLE